MLDLLYVTQRKGLVESATIFDSDDFTVETVKADTLIPCLRQGLKVRGISIDSNSNLRYRNEEKTLVYKDDKFAFLNCSVDANDYQYNFSVVPIHGKFPSFSFGYNIWIKKNEDRIEPNVIKRSNDVYEISLFGKNIGFSCCVMDLGNGVIKPVFRDKEYVNRSQTLIVDKLNDGYNIYRDNLKRGTESSDISVSYYLDNKQVTKGYLESLFGKDSVARMLREARETFHEDPLIEISFANGVRIEFNI